jgi:hypothetical protein
MSHETPNVSMNSRYECNNNTPVKTFFQKKHALRSLGPSSVEVFQKCKCTSFKARANQSFCQQVMAAKKYKNGVCVYIYAYHYIYIYNMTISIYTIYIYIYTYICLRVRVRV